MAVTDKAENRPRGADERVKQQRNRRAQMFTNDGTHCYTHTETLSD